MTEQDALAAAVKKMQALHQEGKIREDDEEHSKCDDGAGVREQPRVH